MTRIVKFIELTLVAGALAVAASAHATILDFTATDGSGVVAAGQLTIDASTPSEVTVLNGSVVGAFFAPNTGAITGFAPDPGGAPAYSPSGAFIYDQLIYPGSDPIVDNDGLLFNVGGVEYNLFSNGPDQYVLYNNVNGYTAEAVNFAIGVPEPATWALMLTGFGLAGAGLRQRRTTATA